MAVDPYPTYARLRAEDPVHASALGAYVLTRYADVTAVLDDNETFQHQYVTQQLARVGPEVESELYFGYFRNMIFVMDGDDHKRIRRLVFRAFTAARSREIRSRASAIADDLFRAHAVRRRIDLVHDFAFPLPMRIIGAILGVPDEDHDRIGRDAYDLAPVLEFLPMSPETLARANRAVESLADYFGELASKRRDDPGDDLFSAMVHATEDGDRLSETELIANAILLYVAGHETTAGGTALAALNLARHPAQRELLKQRPELVANAAEELLRFDGPGQGTARVAIKDTEIAGHPLAAGSFVLAYLGAANRDPDAFPDPDVLDVTRTFSNLPRPATWGGGGHFCLGRNLALQEMQVALETLLAHCPDFEVEKAEFRPTPLMRGLESLTIRW